jgi:hypothetical protein
MNKGIDRQITNQSGVIEHVGELAKRTNAAAAIGGDGGANGGGQGRVVQDITLGS